MSRIIDESMIRDMAVMIEETRACAPGPSHPVRVCPGSPLCSGAGFDLGTCPYCFRFPAGDERDSRTLAETILRVH